MDLNFDIERGILVIKTLVDSFNDNRLFTCDHFPEDIIPEEMVKGSNEHLVYLSLISSIAYLRKEEQLWCLARDAWEEKEAKYLFNPEQILTHPFKEIEKSLRYYNLLVSKAIVKEWTMRNPKSANRRLLQGNDAEIWVRMAQTLYEHDSNVEKLFDVYNFDAVKVLKEFTEGKYSESFPEYHKTRKVILWMVRTQRFSSFHIENLNELPMPVSMHIIRATFMSGAVTGETTSIDMDISSKISEYWHDVAEAGKETLNLSPNEFQIYLWILSKYGCSTGRREQPYCTLVDQCPVGKLCSKGIFENLGTYIKAEIRQTQPQIKMFKDKG